MTTDLEEALDIIAGFSELLDAFFMTGQPTGEEEHLKGGLEARWDQLVNRTR